MSKEHTPVEVFELFVEYDFEASKATNYLVAQRLWAKSEIERLETELAHSLFFKRRSIQAEIDRQSASLRKINHYIKVINGEGITENLEYDDVRLKLNLTKTDITRLYRILKAYGIIDKSITAFEFSRHFLDKSGNNLTDRFVNAYKANAAASENSLVRMMVGHALREHPECLE